MASKNTKTATGQFEQFCGLSTHNPDSSSLLHDIDQRRFVSTVEKEYILRENLIKTDSRTRKSRKLFICDDCLQTVKISMMHPSKRTKQNIDGADIQNIVSDDSVATIVDAIEKGLLTDKQFGNILNAVGMKIHKSIARKDASSSSHNNRVETMKSKSYLEIWNTEVCVEWKQLMQSICNLSKVTDNASARRLTKCTDLVRAQVDSNYISNVALGEALLLLQFSHSKYAVDLFCRTNAAGSFSTVRRTMSLLGCTEFVLPGHDVILAFDNNQVIQRTWMFKYGGKQVVSTVTTMACYDNIHSRTTHQFTKSIPTALFPTTQNRDILLSRYKDFTTDAGNMNRLYRRKYIESRIAKITSECKVQGGEVFDVVSQDNAVLDADDSIFGYSRVHACSRESRVTDAECMAENPNSFKSVANVLDKILEYLNECPEQRNFIPIYMDGAPYSICMKLLKEKYICDDCKMTVSSADQAAHIASNHVGNKNVTWSRKYKKIIVRPGNGHVEMTSVKAIISTFWFPFIKPIAAILGYNSESQLDYAKKAYDHHKSYNLLM